MAQSLIRFWFCVTVALLAVSLANPLIEFVSNAGFFGAEDYTDHSTIDLWPTFLAGAAFLTLHVLQRLGDLLGASRRSDRSRLREWSKALGGPTLARLLPCAFALQILILYAMETLEQCVTLGHPLHGTIWLGGPVLFSLFVHAAFCVVTLLVVGRSVSALTGTVLQIVRLIEELVRFAIGASRAIVAYRLDFPPHSYRLLVLCRIGERAPPSLLA